MRKDYKLLAEKVFDLVKKLSPSEKKHVLSESMRKRKGKRKGDKSYIKLFSLYSSASRFEIKPLEKKFGSSEAAFISANRYLRGFIFESLSRSESEDTDSLSVAKKAVEKGFPRYAKTILEKALKDSLGETDLSKEFQMIDFLEVIDRYYLNQSKGNKPFDGSRYFLDHSIRSKSKWIVGQVRKSIGLPLLERARIVALYEQEVAEYLNSTLLPLTRYEVLVAARILYFAKGDVYKGNSIQPEIEKLILQNPQLLPIEVRINEAHRTITSFILDNNFVAAKDCLQKLMSADHPEHLSSQLNRTWLLDSIFLAAASGELDYAPRAVRDYNKYESLLNSKQRIRLAQAISVIFFHNGDWESAIIWQNKIAIHPGRNQMGIAWMPYLVKAICFYEQGYLYEAKSMVSKYDKIELSCRGSYSETMFSWLGKLIAASGNKLSEQRILGEMLDEFKAKWEIDKEFQLEGSNFSLLLWIQSKVDSESIREATIASNQAGIPLFKIG